MNARFILAVLFAVSILNFVDRQILAILAGKIKADLLISDAQLGFLYGTVFGIFYAVFGVPLGVYADLRIEAEAHRVGPRPLEPHDRGLGLRRRLRVPGPRSHRRRRGRGERVAGRVFDDRRTSSRRRDGPRAFAVYSLGVYVGIGLSSYLGGAVVDALERRVPRRPGALRPARLAGGVPDRGPSRPAPGARWSWPSANPLAEPWRTRRLERRPALTDAGRPSPLRTCAQGDARAPASDIALHVAARWCSVRDETPSPSPSWPRVRRLCGSLFGDPVQWICVALGLYVVATMAQRVKAREPDDLRPRLQHAVAHLATLGFSFLSFTGYAISLWTAHFFVRYHGYHAVRDRRDLGVISAVGGGLGVSWAACSRTGSDAECRCGPTDRGNDERPRSDSRSCSSP